MNSVRHVRMQRLQQMILGLAAIAALATGQAFAQSPADKQAAWTKVGVRVEEAEKTSLAEIDIAVKAIDQRFEEAEKNIRPFVADVLGWGAKARYIASGAEQAINGAAGLLDNVFGSKLSTPAKPDSFAVFARRRFEHHIFAPRNADEITSRFPRHSLYVSRLEKRLAWELFRQRSKALKQEFEAAAATYRTRLEELKTKLLIDLEIDLPDGDPARISPAIPMEKTLLAHVDAVIQEAIASATTDFLVTAGKEAVSQVGGGWLTGMLMTGGAAGGMHVAQNQDPWKRHGHRTGYRRRPGGR